MRPPVLEDTETISIQMNQSKLPEKMMEPRLADPRVGWFTVSQYDYGSNELKSDKKTYIRDGV
jgi:hypothetical protein